MKALLLSAYDAESHRLWRHNLQTMFPLVQWSELTLPARYFPWRVRGNSLSWAFNHRATLTDNYDFLLTTSMTDLSALRGFVPALARLPTAVYCHENQFAYPVNPDPRAPRPNPVEPQMLSLYTALCADRLIFNSAYNRETFLQGVAELLCKLPDHVPTGLLERLRNSCVIPVPLSKDVFVPAIMPFATITRTAEPHVLNIAWNHRWEYDKGPELLLAIAQKLMAQGLRFRLHLLGQRFRQAPASFQELQSLLASYCTEHGITPGHCGYVTDREDYCRLLASADVVLSTALHDFQGLSLLEAAALGCTPLAPQRLVYPEYLGADFLYAATGDIAAEAQSAVQRLQEWSRHKALGLALPRADVQRFSQPSLQGDYADLLQFLTTRKNTDSMPPLVHSSTEGDRRH